MSAPSVKLAKLTRRTSANGKEYFSGLMGASKVLLFRDPSGDDEWGEAWSLLVQPLEPKSGKTSPAKNDPGAVKHRRHPKASKQRMEAQENAPFDDGWNS